MLDRRAFLKASLLGPAFAPILAASGMPAAVKYSTRGIGLDEINEITMRTVMPGIVDDFFKDDALYGIMAIDDEAPLTYRPGEYMGIPR